MKTTLQASLAALGLVIGQTFGAEKEPSLPDHDAYAEAAFRLFTHDELLELIRYYESPVGKKYARVYREIVQRMSAGDQHLSAVVEELRERIHRQLTAPEK